MKDKRACEDIADLYFDVEHDIVVCLVFIITLKWESAISLPAVCASRPRFVLEIDV